MLYIYAHIGYLEQFEQLNVSLYSFLQLCSLSLTCVLRFGCILVDNKTVSLLNTVARCYITAWALVNDRTIIFQNGNYTLQILINVIYPFDIYINYLEVNVSLILSKMI